MSFFEHLVNYNAADHSAIAIVICTESGCFYRSIHYVHRAADAHALRSAVWRQSYYTSPAGYVSLVINLGLYLGIAIAMPYVLYQYGVVAPGLSSTSANAVAGSSFLRCFLFCAGWRCVFHHAADDAEIPD